MATSKRNPFVSVHSIKGINQRRFAVRCQLEDARKKSAKPQGYHFNQPEIGGNHKPKQLYSCVTDAVVKLAKCNGGIKSFGAADYIASHKAK